MVANMVGLVHLTLGAGLTILEEMNFAKTP